MPLWLYSLLLQRVDVVIDGGRPGEVKEKLQERKRSLVFCFSSTVDAKSGCDYSDGLCRKTRQTKVESCSRRSHVILYTRAYILCIVSTDVRATDAMGVAILATVFSLGERTEDLDLPGTVRTVRRPDCAISTLVRTDLAVGVPVQQ